MIAIMLAVAKKELTMLNIATDAVKNRDGLNKKQHFAEKKNVKNY